MKKLIALLLCTTYLFGSNENVALTIATLFALIIFAFNIIVLITQHSFVNTIQLKIKQDNTRKVWIWTQLIPVWNLIAIPITLLKINKQFDTFVQENNLTQNDITFYNNTWGWVWFIGLVLSLLIEILGVVAFIGVIGFLVHLFTVNKSILNYKTKISSYD